MHSNFIEKVKAKFFDFMISNFKRFIWSYDNKFTEKTVICLKQILFAKKISAIIDDFYLTKICSIV